jgi:alcohol dehydrogenase (cytochrome c)
VTKGGVLFTGDLRGRVLAYDAKSGKELWKFQTGSGGPRSVSASSYAQAL